MTKVFVDSGGWVSVLNPRDGLHAIATSYYRDAVARDELITSNYVIQETVTFLTYRNLRHHVRRFQDMTLAAEQRGILSVLWVDRPTHEAAWSVYHQYGDQALSFTDCSSIALCRAEHIGVVFGFDGHFRVAGLDLRPA